MSSLVPVSPLHSVALSQDYEHMIGVAPREDFVVRRLARRDAGKTTLMMGELVIAGAATREQYELARTYPLHFRKTYYPGKMHGDPAIEMERHALACQVLGSPPPIGATPNSFRSCFVPGLQLSRCSKLGTEPDESNIATANQLEFATLAGLWSLLEQAYNAHRALEEAGLCHGDSHLHNFIVCPSPLKVVPIDFEISTLRGELSAEAWAEKCRLDRGPLLKHAIFVQSALGEQKGPLAAESLESLEQLVQPAGAFRRALSVHSFQSPIT